MGREAELADQRDKANPEILADEYLKLVMSLGEASAVTLKRQIVRMIERASPFVINESAAYFTLIKEHTHDSAPSGTGIYLKLFHGRTPFDMEMDDWGSDGPWIGPLKWVHFTYKSSFRIGFQNGKEYWSGSSDTIPPSPLFCHEDCLYYDGVYYGDWEFVLLPEHSSENAS